MAALISWLMSTVWPQIRGLRQNKYNTPLPEQCHVTLTSDVIRGRPVLVVGDVHGCFEELSNLLEMACDERENPFVVFVGDMINKGPQSVAVLRLVREMVERGQAAAVRGNHEESILRELWALNDKDDYCLLDRYRWLLLLSEDDFTFLQQLPYTISIPSKRALIVHAGLVPGVPLERQSLENLTHMRNITHEDYFSGRGLVGSSKVDQGEAWASLWPGPDHVYFGHDARRGLQLWPFATGLDTGCLYGNVLTGVFIGSDDPEFLVVRAKRAYAAT